MRQYTIAEASIHLSELADKAACGEEVIFTKGTEKFQIIRMSSSTEAQPVR